MYAAGYVEGVLTNERITETAHNIYGFFFTPQSPPSSKIQAWLSEQEKWVRKQISAPYSSLSPLWKAVAGSMAQYDGMVQGYTDASPNTTLPISTQFTFRLLAGWGDMLDLINAIHPEKRPDFSRMTLEEARRYLDENGHCSALVKILGDFSDVFMGQSAWFTFGAMNRIYKHYNFELSIQKSGQKVSFSSYPGALVSQDDFYIMDSGLVMLQTTNGIINQSLYDLVTPHALLAWQRVKVANYLAKDGKQWCDIVSQYNSGTYNNQYMVIDTKKFKPGSPLPEGFLWVAEQIPGQVESADLTNVLKYGYWPSYNVPYFPDIWEKSGYGTYGDGMTHELAPRAQIFRRDQGKVHDIDSFKHMMRYNDYLNDPYSHGDPGKAICSRFDLDPTNPGPFGCYDTKVTNIDRSKALVAEAINGPTTQNGLPPFVWSPLFNNVPHEGQPKTWDFNFQLMDPQWK